MSDVESFVGMSDEDFEKHMETNSPEDSVGDPSGSLATSEEKLDEVPADSAVLPEDAPDELTPGDETLDIEAGDIVKEGDKIEDKQTADEEDQDDEAPKAEDDSANGASDLDELYKPFKASGRDISVKSVEEAKKLMSMGVDYVQKLQGFKQHRKTIKTLGEHKIDGNRLNLLIDASNGNKDAINTLIQEHSIDTEDLSEVKDSNYTPSDNSVSDSQVEMDDVIDRIQATSSFSTTSDIVSNQWDDNSKKVIFANPKNLELLNEHVSNGTYERVMTEVTRAKLFGGLQGLSDLEAYQQVGQELYKQEQATQTATPTQVSRKPVAKATVITDKKLRASPSKATPRSTAPVKYDYAGMSDEEFEKHLIN